MREARLEAVPMELSGERKLPGRYDEDVFSGMSNEYLGIYKNCATASATFFNK